MLELIGGDLTGDLAPDPARMAAHHKPRVPTAAPRCTELTRSFAGTIVLRTGNLRNSPAGAARGSGATSGGAISCWTRVPAHCDRQHRLAIVVALWSTDKAGIATLSRGVIRRHAYLISMTLFAIAPAVAFAAAATALIAGARRPLVVSRQDLRSDRRC